MSGDNSKVRVWPAKVLAGMLIFSVICMLIPRRWDRSDQIKVVAQPITLLQGLMARGTGWAAPRAEAPAQEGRSPAVDRQMLEGQLLAMAEELRSLRQRNSELAGLREGGYIPRRLGQLIAADVISRDSLAYRSVLEIDRGKRNGTARGQWATSAVYLDRGGEDGIKARHSVFTAESLVGQIVWVGPYTSRVQLLTDPASRVPARIARIQPNTPAGVAYVPDTFVLEGTGQGMVIQQVDYRLVESGEIQVGDLVVVQPSANLAEEAASLRRAGRVTGIRRDRTQVVCTLQVSPLVAFDSLRHVYVFDPRPGGDRAGG
jgi:cell shape-determining protein MreC